MARFCFFAHICFTVSHCPKEKEGKNTCIYQYNYVSLSHKLLISNKKL